MEIDSAKEFLRHNHRAVLATRRSDGSPQLSPVVCAVDGAGDVVVSTRETAVKTRNIARDPRVSLCVFGDGYFGEWVQIDGTATVISLPDAMDGLISYYKAVGGEHSNWDEYRRAMVDERRVLVVVTIERAGPSRAG